jgi:hypothetical protein
MGEKLKDEGLIDIIAEGIVDRFTYPDRKGLGSSERLWDDVLVAELHSGVVIVIAVNAIHKGFGEYPIIKPYADRSTGRWQANN